MAGHMVMMNDAQAVCQSMHVIDSHTEGEPTRVILEGGPDLGIGSLRERLIQFRNSYDHWRQFAINEPRGFEAIVGAWLCQPTNPACAAGVIFFNNTGYLGMCGHGAIGVAVTLHYLGKIGLGTHSLETPVGTVGIELLEPNLVAVENVPSFRYRSQVSIEVEQLGTVTGDIAWGGNWFFLVNTSPLPLLLEHLRGLSDAASLIKETLHREGICGADGAEIDHIEFFGPAISPNANSRNFVYCPGGAYDRSPCGTGTSAKLACLAADGKLKPGETWVQESFLGSRFSATYRNDSSGLIVPRIVGSAYLCSKAILIQQPNDSFRYGINLRNSSRRDA